MIKSIQKSIFYLFLLTLSVACQPVFAGIQASPNEVSIIVSNVPTDVPSLFVPIIVTSDELDLYRISLRDIFVRGYVASLEKDPNGKVLGVSFGSLSSKSLPDRLEAIIKVRPSLKNTTVSSPPEVSSSADEEEDDVKEDEKDAAIIEENVPENNSDVKPSETELKSLTAQPSEKLVARKFPIGVNIYWAAPWVYTKPTKELPSSFAGFNSLNLASSSSREVLKQDKKQKIKQKEDEAKDFYVRSFGQTLIRDQRNVRHGKFDKNLQLPNLEEVNFFVKMPPNNTSDRVYVPVLIENPDHQLKISVKDPNWQEGTILRVIDNELIELSSVNNIPLPSDAVLNGKLIFEVSDSTLLNKITLGNVLSEPSKPVSGVSVIINPSSVGIYNQLLPLNIFK